MSDFTRVTVVGTARKAELVVPSDQSLGSLIPRLMVLLDEPAGPVSRPLTLVRPTGEQLDLALSTQQQLVEDGELLRMLRQDSAPPPPEVSDVTDVVADSLAERTDLWSDRHRQWMGAVGIGASTFAAGALLVLAPSALSEAGVALIVGGWFVLMLAVATLTGRLGLRWSAMALVAASVGLAAPLAMSLSLVTLAAISPLVAGCIAVGLAWLALGIGVGWGLRISSALWGSAVGVAASALPLTLLATGVSDTGTWAITGVAAIAACGLLPWYAMSASGLTGLDDEVSAGSPRRRRDVLVSVGSAYQGLTWATVAVAAPITAAAIVLLASGNIWALWLAVALTLVTLLRSRTFPLAAQAIALWSAAGIITLVGIVSSAVVADQVAPVLVALVSVAVLIALTVAARPTAHRRASLRRLGNFVEALAVIALIPLLLGVFDIFNQLLNTF
ncbi:type VII secretion integral membrane protein EccD [Homoserinimonas sp. OAct 916]|uniref:type VII secretion integral membrane protein EccD n=1 Tax=Homoserinimonas sp. OAct 916 TaxID=2211450 RepID=UPI000DBE2393|nr:type VII secretion integral membrane protein EccD [Homoserinimonas sp. OAct 916]